MSIPKKIVENKEGWNIGSDEINGHTIMTHYDHVIFELNDEDENTEIFVTIIFDERLNLIYTKYYKCYDTAKEGHKKAVEWVKKGCREDELD